MLSHAVVLLAAVSLSLALDNGLGLTPQMGWNSWNHFGCDVSEKLIMTTIDSMVDSGLAAAGYRYVNVDDCWQISRDKQTHEIIPDPDRFPSGMKALADYAHSKGLLFGLYSDAGYLTCQRRPGSLNYEEVDAKIYASWGVDYLKYDNCWSITMPKQRYPPMRDALNATGRPIFFSMCEWGGQDVATWARDVGNSWRTTMDIKDSWSSLMRIARVNNKWAEYAGPGGWNDPDMLEVGNGGLTPAEERSHFALWALVKAPLLTGNDVTTITPDVFDILAAPEVIAVNQDPLGVQGTLVAENDSTGGQVWAGPLSGGSWAALLLNEGGSEGEQVEVSADWSSMGVPQGPATVRDLWARKDLGVFTGSFSAMLGRHESMLIKVTPVARHF